jgi:hypothetical protein
MFKPGPNSISADAIPQKCSTLSLTNFMAVLVAEREGHLVALTLRGSFGFILSRSAKTT